ncbi:MAG: YicC family protein [Chitinophagales bacterium]|nr:YicC family protein [Chitinophagales bacterium]
MLQSMTGYGKTNVLLNNFHYSIEIKTLNSKSLDINFRLPNSLRVFELDWRKTIAEQLVRGKIDVYFNEEKNITNNTILNIDKIYSIYEQLKSLSDEKQIPLGDVLPSIIRLNEVSKNDLDFIDENAAITIGKAFEQTIQDVVTFRKKEGESLYHFIESQLLAIQSLLQKIAPLEDDRRSKLTDKLKQSIENATINYDKDRFEQELIYYIEKLDISEEKDRLATHCNYFFNYIKESHDNKGKKLQFICQEIGREINTIGSKANDAAIQTIVVNMKDALEKIKEQLNNIL